MTTTATHTAQQTIRLGRLTVAQQGQELHNVEHVTFGKADFVKFSVGQNILGQPVMFEMPTAQARKCIPSLFS